MYNTTGLYVESDRSVFEHTDLIGSSDHVTYNFK